MNLVYEEGGAFKVGRILSEETNALHIENQFGKRTKIKNNCAMLRFDDMECAEFAAAVELTIQEIDIGLLWECAPQEEVSFALLAAEYFGGRPNPVQQAAALYALHGAPVHFHRKGKGMYRPAPPDILQAALAGLEKKRKQAEMLAQWVEALSQHTWPSAWPQNPSQQETFAAKLLTNPDKNSPEYKALSEASSKTCQSPERLLLACGAFANMHSLLRACFVATHFPGGSAHPPATLGLSPSIDINALPKAPAPAFSIDDTSTTEIDDAFSVEWSEAEPNTAIVGVHIAAPALWFEPNTPLDDIARERLSTVYAPGDKITMLPEHAVAAASLAAGQWVPALSLYVPVCTETGMPKAAPSTVLNRVYIEANLRHNLLDAFITPEWLASLNHEPANIPDTCQQHLPETCTKPLSLLWLAAQALKAQREAVRGEPEKHTRQDYNFTVHDDGQVDITPRRRDAPLDVLVAEWMIYTNEAWGGLLHQQSVCGVYRVQPPMGRVRMSVHAAPHAGLGVAQYAWATSPLRRYIDLINQRQLLSIVQGTTPPYHATDASLLGAINQFDTTYKAYAEYQSQMERYWCLRWIQQRQQTRFHGVVIKDELVRLNELPLFVRLVGVATPGRGVAVEVELTEVDDITLTVHCKLIAQAEGTPTALAQPDEEPFA